MTDEVYNCLRAGYSKTAYDGEEGRQFVDGCWWYPRHATVSLKGVLEDVSGLLDEAKKIHAADLDLCDKDLAEVRAQLEALERKCKV